MNTDYDSLVKRIAELEQELAEARAHHVSHADRRVDVQSESWGEAEARIRESEERFRIIADTAPVLIWIAGVDKGCYFFNKGWLDFTGRSMEQETGHGWAEGVHPDDLERCLHIYNYSFDARKEFSMEYRLRRSDGEYRWIWDRGVPRYTGDGVFVGFVGGCMEVQEQKNFAEELERKVEQRTTQLKIQNSIFKHSEENAHIGSYAWNLNTNELECSDNLYRLIGYEPQEFAPSFEQFISFLHPNDRNKAIREGLRAFETKVLIQSTYRVVTRTGDIKHLRLSVNFILEAGNQLMIGALQDVSKDIKLNEALRIKNIELRRNNEELASFSYVASHDLQEPLRKIRAFSGRILEREEHLSENSTDYFNRIMLAAARMQKLIEALLSYSGTNSSDIAFVDTDLNGIVQEVITDLEGIIDEKKAVFDLGKLPVIPVIPVQFYQLMQNLVNNGIKYSRQGEVPVIRIHCEIISKEGDESEFYKISVADNGIGFDQQYESRIFDLFQRLHGRNEYEGTGIGLAICKKIVQNHGGYITAEGRPGQGATFNVYLPVSRD
ncbi:PAS domain-containing sensor histidine kinase [Dyadobacter sp.]|uniref:PAS domain-containing sensor histidine kinase n=1 Tax=Dyadobacter sp. TaxID=1914288 RepID=UPI003F717AC2